MMTFISHARTIEDEMISDKDAARHISEVLLKCGADINESIRYVQESCSKDEFEAYREATSKIMVDIYETFDPIFKKHPDLKPKGLN